MKEKWKEKQRSDKFYIILTLLIRISLLAAIAGSVYEVVIWQTGWITLFVSSLSFLLTFLPYLIQQTYKIRLPGEIQIIIVLFIYAALFLGMAREWYHRFWWWDSLMHGFSGVALGFAGFLILYVLYKSAKLQASFFLIALFSFCFAVALGAIWEIFEFAMDSLFGDDMQRARYTIEYMQEHGYEDTRFAIYDTMWDMILNSAGAFIASLCGYIYLKKGEIFLFDRLIRKFEQVNPELFFSGQGDNGECDED